MVELGTIKSTLFEVAFNVGLEAPSSNL